MKRLLRPLLMPSLLLGLFTSATIRADENSPHFCGATLSIHATTYDWVSASESGDYHTDTYFNSTGLYVSVSGLIANSNLATVSGSGISGYISGGAYGDLELTSSSGVSLTFNGRSYTTMANTTTYTVDLANNMVSSEDTVTYIGSGGTFSIADDGQISGSESGYYLGGIWYVNSSGSESFPERTSPSFTLFGNPYYLAQTWWGTSYDSNGDGNSQSGEEYVTDNGGNMSVGSWSGPAGTGSSTSGWDPYAGSFSDSNSSGTIAWNPRTAPSFAPAQLWVNGALVDWSSGSIGSDGIISDDYTGTTAQGGSITLTIYGSARSYIRDSAAVAVTVNGTAEGEYAQATGFTHSNIHFGGPNQTAPFFCGLTLWVDGTEFPFVGGWQDNAGSRSDVYVNASSGTLTISGNTSDVNSGDVLVNYNGIVSGDFSTSSFEVGSLDIQTQNPGGLPSALWARGRFYQRTGSSYTSGAAIISFTWTDSDSIVLTGSGDAGSLTGSYDLGSAGLFTLSEGSIPVPACPANADGTLILAASPTPENFPPAVMITGLGIWTFLGTAADEGDPSFLAAYYGNAVTAHVAEDNHCLLRIRLDGSVTLCDYDSETHLLGQYKPVPHLFVTNITDSLPMPIYGVDPLQNFALWDLVQPPTGLPDTFLVHGEIWRYSGTDANGNALYDGYYTGQQLSLAPPGTDGLRLVAVTDPIHGDTLGTLNDVRGSVRMRDGSVVYSGSSQGVRINPTLDENNLHTIAADLDITGNVLTFGALTNDAAVAGLTMQFSDSNNVASLGFALGRSAADWSWYHASANPDASAVPMMNLDSGNKLTLYNPANPEQAGITLDPSAGGMSTIRGDLQVHGAIRFLPAGDLDMGPFTNGAQP